MDKFLSKLRNFWFYHKTHVLIALAVVAVLGWLWFSSAGTPEADYHIGIVRAVPLTEAARNSIESAVTAAGEDVNGDGQILVKLHTYYADLADDSANAAADNAEAVAALDADLVGKVSGIFLLEDVETFRRITNNLLSDSSVPFASGLFLTLRRDADESYIRLADNLS